MMLFYVVQYILILFCVLQVSGNHPEVEIPQGRLRGGTRTNKDGGTYYSFQNIPFGKPPVGKLRFRAPEPAGGWNGTRDATEDVPQCIQQHSGSGQEDCLYLTVVTPELPGVNVTKRPVMVWIYGGAFNMGSAMNCDTGAKFLLTKDVILVAFNYRVGIFGFISLDDPNLGVTGNAGMKDQVLALKWVKGNIEYFGGDPDNVLIFGESAGAMSVHLHILSPLSRGLFHKAISESGCALTDLVTPQFRNNGVVIAKNLGIQTENWEEMLKSLRKLPAATLNSAQQSLSPIYEYFNRPIVEIASGEPAFMPEDPLNIIRSGNYSQVPYITGFNDAEGLLFQNMAKHRTGKSILITDFSEYVPGDFKLEAGSEGENNVCHRIKEFYYGDAEPSRDDISGAVKLSTDHGFAFPAYRSTLEHLKTALYPIYFYLFSADTKLNLFKKRDATSAAFPGAAHGDDLGYIFYSLDTPQNIKEGSVEDLGIKNIVNLWTNFAIYGNPTPAGFDYKWEPVRENQFNYLHIDTNETTLQVNPKPESFRFWTQLYQKYFPENVK